MGLTKLFLMKLYVVLFVPRISTSFYCTAPISCVDYGPTLNLTRMLSLPKDPWDSYNYFQYNYSVTTSLAFPWDL